MYRWDSSCASMDYDPHRAAFRQFAVVFDADDFIARDRIRRFAEHAPVEKAPAADANPLHRADARNGLNSRFELRAVEWRSKCKVIGRKKSRLRTQSNRKSVVSG